MSGFRIELPARGVELAVTDWGGSGPLAVISHANGFCSALYSPVAERLRDVYHVVGFDSRGHGDSSAPEPVSAYEWAEFAEDWRAVAGALCGRMGVPSVALGIGHSFGGTSLLRAAIADPSLYERLVLVDPVMIPPAAERVGAHTGEGPHPMAVAARRRTAVFPSRDAVRENWSRREVFGDWEERVLELYLEHGFRDLEDGSVGLKCPPAVEAAVFDAGSRSDAFESLPSLRTKTLWLHAAQGNFPIALVERAAALATCVELCSLDYGHLMPMTHPQELASTILEWAGKMPPRLSG